MSFTLSILRCAQKELAELPFDLYEQVRDGIRRLADDPLPLSCTKLAQRDGWRICVGKYRVVYEVDAQERRVTVLHVGRRAGG